MRGWQLPTSSLGAFSCSMKHHLPQRSACLCLCSAGVTSLAFHLGARDQLWCFYGKHFTNCAIFPNHTLFLEASFHYEVQAISKLLMALTGLKLEVHRCETNSEIKNVYGRTDILSYETQMSKQFQPMWHTGCNVPIVQDGAPHMRLNVFPRNTFHVELHRQS